MIVSNIIGY